MSARQTALGNNHQTLLAALPITAPVGPLTTTPINTLGMKYLAVQANLIYGSGGTSVDVYVQTSVDGGATWVDIMEFNFLLASAIKISAVSTAVALAAATAPTDGTLAANSILNGLLGERIRLKYKSAGTYAGTTLSVDMVMHG